MSDVGIAPAPSPAPAPAPVQEAVINPNPVNAPKPMGQTAPDAPPQRHETRRETIAKAFKRAEEPGPAKPRMGHNNPPEPMAKEEGFSLKKRPSEQQPPATARERGEHGHFAPAASRQQPQHQPAAAPLPAHAPYRDAPQRMSSRAQAEWAAAPESVRGEVHRMHREFSNAYQRWRGDVETMNTLRPYHQMAAQQGTSVARALGNYVAMEDKLRRDPIGGLDVIVNNLNLRAADGHKLTLQDIAYYVLTQSPQQHQMMQSQNVQTALSQQLAAVQHGQQALAHELQRQQYRRNFSRMRRGVDAYAAMRPRFDELGDLIHREIQLGFNLDQAYQRAELLRPATHAAQTRSATHAAQTRAADRSIHGAPAGAAAPGRVRGNGKPPERREAILNAMRRVNGAL